MVRVFTVPIILWASAAILCSLSNAKPLQSDEDVPEGIFGNLLHGQQSESRLPFTDIIYRAAHSSVPKSQHQGSVDLVRFLREAQDYANSKVLHKISVKSPPGRFHDHHVTNSDKSIWDISPEEEEDFKSPIVQREISPAEAHKLLFEISPVSSDNDESPSVDFKDLTYSQPYENDDVSISGKSKGHGHGHSSYGGGYAEGEKGKTAPVHSTINKKTSHVHHHLPPELLTVKDPFENVLNDLEKSSKSTSDPSVYPLVYGGSNYYDLTSGIAPPPTYDVYTANVDQSYPYGNADETNYLQNNPVQTGTFYIASEEVDFQLAQPQPTSAVPVDTLAPYLLQLSPSGPDTLTKYKPQSTNPVPNILDTYVTQLATTVDTSKKYQPEYSFVLPNKKTSYQTQPYYAVPDKLKPSQNLSSYSAPYTKIAYQPESSYSAPYTPTAYQPDLSYSAPDTPTAYQPESSYSAPDTPTAYQPETSYSAPYTPTAYQTDSYSTPYVPTPYQTESSYSTPYTPTAYQTESTYSTPDTPTAYQPDSYSYSAPDTPIAYNSESSYSTPDAPKEYKIETSYYAPYVPTAYQNELSYSSPDTTTAYQTPSSYSVPDTPTVYQTPSSYSSPDTSTSYQTPSSYSVPDTPTVYQIPSSYELADKLKSYQTQTPYPEPQNSYQAEYSYGLPDADKPDQSPSSYEVTENVFPDSDESSYTTPIVSTTESQYAYGPIKPANLIDSIYSTGGQTKIVTNTLTPVIPITSSTNKQRPTQQVPYTPYKSVSLFSSPSSQGHVYIPQPQPQYYGSVKTISKSPIPSYAPTGRAGSGTPITLQPTTSSTPVNFQIPLQPQFQLIQQNPSNPTTTQFYTNGQSLILNPYYSLPAGFHPGYMGKLSKRRVRSVHDHSIEDSEDFDEYYDPDDYDSDEYFDHSPHLPVQPTHLIKEQEKSEQKIIRYGEVFNNFNMKQEINDKEDYYDLDDDYLWGDDTAELFDSHFSKAFNFLSSSEESDEGFHHMNQHFHPPQPAHHKSHSAYDLNHHHRNPNSYFSYSSNSPSAHHLKSPPDKQTNNQVNTKKDVKPPKKNKKHKKGKKTPSRRPKPPTEPKPKDVFQIHSPNQNLNINDLDELLKSWGYNTENAEIQVINPENTNPHRPFSPSNNRFKPPQRPVPPRPLNPTTVRPELSTTPKKVYRPHKDTERHKEESPASFVYEGSHNLVFPGLYSHESY